MATIVQNNSRKELNRWSCIWIFYWCIIETFANYFSKKTKVCNAFNMWGLTQF